MPEKMPLSNRCRVHARKMWEEGWYVTANVLDEAANEIDRLTQLKALAERLLAKHETPSPHPGGR